VRLDLRSYLVLPGLLGCHQLHLGDKCRVLDPDQVPSHQGLGLDNLGHVGPHALEQGLPPQSAGADGGLDDSHCSLEAENVLEVVSQRGVQEVLGCVAEGLEGAIREVAPAIPHQVRCGEKVRTDLACKQLAHQLALQTLLLSPDQKVPRLL
jgi:hypothetical protein